jgi:hypothetical protein
VKSIWEDNLIEPEQSSNNPALKKSGGHRKRRKYDYDLEELREHIDLVSHSLGRVYHHARERTGKENNRLRNFKLWSDN